MALYLTGENRNSGRKVTVPLCLLKITNGIEYRPYTYLYKNKKFSEYFESSYFSLNTEAFMKYTNGVSSKWDTFPGQRSEGVMLG